MLHRVQVPARHGRVEQAVQWRRRERDRCASLQDEQARAEEREEEIGERRRRIDAAVPPDQRGGEMGEPTTQDAHDEQEARRRWHEQVHIHTISRVLYWYATL